MNLAYALELKNLNQSGANYAAIDLGDKKKSTAFQITAESKKSKVQETLDGFVAAGFGKEFDSLRILMMSDRQRKYPGLNVPKKLDFDEMADVIDIKGFLHHVKSLAPKEQAKIAEFMMDEMTWLAQLEDKAKTQSDNEALAEYRAHFDHSAFHDPWQHEGSFIRFNAALDTRCSMPPGRSAETRTLPALDSPNGRRLSARHVGSGRLVYLV